jgi:hypothetical protein
MRESGKLSFFWQIYYFIGRVKAGSWRRFHVNSKQNSFCKIGKNSYPDRPPRNLKRLIIQEQNGFSRKREINRNLPGDP